MSKVLSLAFLFLVSATTICADPVTLTNGGTVSIAANSVQVHFTGSSGFSLSYIGDVPSTARSFGMNTALAGFGSVNFNGSGSHFFKGSITFSDNFLTGGVTAYNDFFFTTPPIFSVNFDAFGFVVIDSDGGVRRTTFTVATPEPASILLLTGGLLGAVAIGWKRRT